MGKMQRHNIGKGIYISVNTERKSVEVATRDEYVCENGRPLLYDWWEDNIGISPSEVNTVIVQDAAIADISFVTVFHNAEKFSAKGSAQLRDISPLLGLKHLQDIDLSWTDVRDISPLYALPSLERLILSNTDISVIPQYPGSASLKELDVSNTQLEGSTSWAKNMPSLETLILSKTRQVSDMSGLTSCKNLTYLDISSTSTSDISPLKDMTRLQILHINGTNVSSVEPLNSANALQELYVSWEEVERMEGMSALRERELLEIITV